MAIGGAGKDGRRDSQGVWDGHGHTAVFNMENQQGPAGQLRELCSVSCGSLAGRGVWGRRDTCPPGPISTLLISYTSIQKKKFFFLKKTKILSEVCQTEKQKYNSPYMWNLKRNDTNELTYKPKTDLQS